MDFKNLQESQTDRYRKLWKNLFISLRQKCPYSEFFWFVFPAFGLNTEIYRIYKSPYSVQMQENTNHQKNSECRHF